MQPAQDSWLLHPADWMNPVRSGRCVVEGSMVIRQEPISRKSEAGLRALTVGMETPGDAGCVGAHVPFVHCSRRAICALGRSRGVFGNALAKW